MRQKLLLAILVVFLFLANIASADIIVVSLATSPLQGDVAGPFSLIFQLTDGNGIGDGNNTVTLFNFQFGSGGPSGAPSTFGGVTGNVNSTVTLVDTSFLNYFIQPFTPGATLGFTMSTTNQLDSGGIPDGFGFSIGDKTGQAIPTLSFSDVFVEIDMDSAHPLVQTFGSDTSRLPAGGGGPIAIGAPTLAAVPEPSSLALTCGVFGFIVACSWRRRRYSAQFMLRRGL
jgi:hypothetical protein